MITERDLKEAIAECQGVRDPNANTCIKLAAFYVILDHIQQTQTADTEKADTPTYSYMSAPIGKNTVYYESESDFARKIYGMDYEQIMPIVDELMDTLSILNPSLYNGVMRKISEI